MALHYEDAIVQIHRYVVGPIDNNVFIVRCKSTGEGLLIDAANEHELLLECCQRFDVRHVFETHGHWDHIGAVSELRDAGYDVSVTAADAAMLPSYDLVIDDDVEFVVGKVKGRTIVTPGHTPGSVCFLLQDSPVLFSGDTLFPGGPGNTRTELGDFDTIIASIDDRLFHTLAPNTLVMPGHGDDTTIGNERPHLDKWVARGW